MKNILFITYYWPPSGKASLHWPLKVIKYLPEFGLTPSVLTAEKDVFSLPDESMLKEISPELKVIRTKSFEPFDVYKRFTGKKEDDQLVPSETISKENKGLTHKISVWLRMNLFIPDARIGWYRPAVKKASDYLSKVKFDGIVSIGPPQTSHLIGMKLSKKFNIPFYPVFIDPWVDISYYKGFKRSSLTLALDNYLEKKVLRNSKAAIFVTGTMQDYYIKKYPFLVKKPHVLYWGYNEEDFKSIECKNEINEYETIVHAGNIFDHQNPPLFWKQVRKEIDSGRKLKLKFIGTVSPKIKNEIIKNGLEEYTTYKGFLSYKNMLEEICKAGYLLACATEPRHVPGKLFEYLRTGNPIIAFGDENEEVKKIIEEANAGMMFRYDEGGKEFFNSSKNFNTDIEKIKMFDRKNIAEQLSEIIKKTPD